MLFLYSHVIIQLQIQVHLFRLQVQFVSVEVFFIDGCKGGPQQALVKAAFVGL